MNIRTIKISIIALISLFLMIEGIYLFVFSGVVNSFLKSDRVKNIVDQETGLVLSYKSAQVKTYPNFSVRLLVDEIALKTSDTKTVFSAKNFDTTVLTIPLLFKKISVLGLKTENLRLILSRNSDGKIYVGNYLVNIPKIENESFDFNLNGIKIRDAVLVLQDKVTGKVLNSKINSAHFYYKKNKIVGLILSADFFVNEKKKSDIFVNFSSKLPLQKGLADSLSVCEGKIDNLDLSDFDVYISPFFEDKLVSASGILNADFKKDKNLILNSKLEKFRLDMKNPLDSIKSDEPITINSALDFHKNNLLVNSLSIESLHWKILVDGLIKNYMSNKPADIKPDLNVTVSDADIHSLYWLMPSIPGDPRDVMQKFKKYGAWGKANGNIQVKGNASLPEIFGELEASDVYIVKDNPLVPHCKIFAKFLKDNVKIKTRVFAGYGEYVDVDGITEMKINGKGDFHVSSSKNVDLNTAEYMLVPVHEVVGFDLGPVPYMKIKGKGNIDIRTKGTVLDGEVVGRFNFRNTEASLNGLNTTINNADGSLVFDKKNMHFYTNHAYIKKSPVKIDGLASLDGNIDFDITSKEINLKDLLDILNTSPMLISQKKLAEPIKSAEGKVDTSIKLKGVVKDFGEIIKNNTLDISGKLILNDVKAALKYVSVPVEHLKGPIAFDNNGWNVDMNGILAGAKLFIKGYADSKSVDVTVNSAGVKTDELIKIIAANERKLAFLNKIPYTNSKIFFNARYKALGDIKKLGINPSKLFAEGYFKPALNEDKEPFGIQKGSFKLQGGKLLLNSFNINFYGSVISADGKIDRFFSDKPIINGKLNIADLDISCLDSIRELSVLPMEVRKLLNAYENYRGNADIHITCKNNILDGFIDLNDIKFNHSYFKTPIAVDSGKILLDGSKLTMKSIIAQVDGIPVFLTFSAWDFDKTMKFSGYLTTKLTELLVNKYINAFLLYPVKLKGDISLMASISGNLNDFRIDSTTRLSSGADIYYMGANLGDETDKREVKADIIVNQNTYNIKKLDYVRYMTSQNDRTYPLTILNMHGVVSKNKNNVYLRNVNVTTLNNANAKIFNVIFKKSVLKSGMFNCNLNLNGNISNPKIRGTMQLGNVEMPLYDTLLKNVALVFNDKSIHIDTSGYTFNSDFSMKAKLKNQLKPPFVIEDLVLSSERLNLDKFIDSLTRIPTPDTTIKMTGVSGNSKNIIPVNVSDFQIKKGKMTVKNIIIRDLPANNFVADFSLGRDMVLKLDKLWFDVTTGKMTGAASYNFANGRIKATVSALNVDANKVATSLFNVKDQIFGKANGSIVVSTRGNSEDERIKNMFGYVYFEIADGKMPKLGSVEYLLKAGNFIKSGITGASLSNFIDLIAPIKTGYFDSIKGNFALKNGIAQNIEVYSKGDNLNIYMNGEFDILQQYADLRVYGRLTKKATSILGKVGNLSFNSLLNAIPGFKLDNKDKTKLIQDLNKIPGVELSDQQYRIFTVKIDGKLSDEKFVKNFRWIE